MKKPKKTDSKIVPPPKVAGKAAPKGDEFPPAEGGEEEEEEEEVDEDKPKGDEASKSDAEEIARLRAKVDVLEAAAQSAPATIDARVNLVARAREILGDSAQTDGKADVAIQREIIAKIMPALAKRAKDSRDPAYVRALYDAAIEKHLADRSDLMTATAAALGVPHGDSNDFDLGKEIQTYADNLGGKRKAASP